MKEFDVTNITEEDLSVLNDTERSLYNACIKGIDGKKYTMEELFSTPIGAWAYYAAPPSLLKFEGEQASQKKRRWDDELKIALSYIMMIKKLKSRPNFQSFESFERFWLNHDKLDNECSGVFGLYYNVQYGTFLGEKKIENLEIKSLFNVRNRAICFSKAGNEAPLSEMEKSILCIYFSSIKPHNYNMESVIHRIGKRYELSEKEVLKIKDEANEKET
jgi:hypothetical protein